MSRLGGRALFPRTTPASGSLWCFVAYGGCEGKDLSDGVDLELDSRATDRGHKRCRSRPRASRRRLRWDLTARHGSRSCPVGRSLEPRSSSQVGIMPNEHIGEEGPTIFAHACRLGAEGMVSKRVDGTYSSGSCRAWIKVRNPASMCHPTLANHRLQSCPNANPVASSQFR
jgi:hypothetical protein